MRPEIVGIFVPIVAIIMGCSIAIISIWAEHKRKAQLLDQNHRERMNAIEKGMELPPLPTAIVGDNKSNGPSTATAAKSLRSGIMLMLIGGLLFFAIERMGAEEIALFGLIPAAIGVANLIYAAIQWDKEKGKALETP
jgi:hypothetical protein